MTKYVCLSCRVQCWHALILPQAEARLRAVHTLSLRITVHAWLYIIMTRPRFFFPQRTQKSAGFCYAADFKYCTYFNLALDREPFTTIVQNYHREEQRH